MKRERKVENLEYFEILGQSKKRKWVVMLERRVPPKILFNSPKKEKIRPMPM